MLIFFPKGWVSGIWLGRNWKIRGANDIFGTSTLIGVWPATAAMSVMRRPGTMVRRPWWRHGRDVGKCWGSFTLSWRKNMSASWLFSLGTWPLPLLFALKRLQTLEFRWRQAIFELAGKDPVLVTGDFNAEIDERGPQHFVTNGLKLAVNEWVDSILSFQLEGFKFGECRIYFQVFGLFRTSLKHDWSAVCNEAQMWNGAFRFFECLISMKPPNCLEKFFQASSIRMIGNFFLMVPDLLLEAITIQSMPSSDWCRSLRWCNTRISEILRFVDSPFWGQFCLEIILDIASIRFWVMHVSKLGVSYWLEVETSIFWLSSSQSLAWWKNPIFNTKIYSSPWSRSQCEKLAHFPRPERSQRTCFGGYGRLTQENTRGWTVATDLLMHKSLIGAFLACYR